jgi:hypothetical protein
MAYDGAAMPISVHRHGTVVDFEYSFVGRGTLLARCDKAEIVSGSYRVLLSRLDAEEARFSLQINQVVWYVPNLTSFRNPLDIGSAAVSYARRHPAIKAMYTVAPQGGLVAIAADVVIRSLPGIDARMLRDPTVLTPLLRRREPDLPHDWHELPHRCNEAA